MPLGTPAHSGWTGMDRHRVTRRTHQAVRPHQLRAAWSSEQTQGESRLESVTCKARHLQKPRKCTWRPCVHTHANMAECSRPRQYPSELQAAAECAGTPRQQRP